MDDMYSMSSSRASYREFYRCGRCNFETDYPETRKSAPDVVIASPLVSPPKKGHQPKEGFCSKCFKYRYSMGDNCPSCHIPLIFKDTGIENSSGISASQLKQTG